MTTQLIPVNEVQTMAIAVAKSGLFGMKTPEQALALMLVAQSEGLHPARAALEYHIIQGRPSLKADAMLSRFQAAGGKGEWHDYTPACVSATFSHPQGGSIRIEWTRKMADDAKLTNKDTWKQYPRQMLRARCISEGIRTVFPGVSVGLYTPEEVGDFVPAGEEKKSGRTEKTVEGEVLPPDLPPEQEPYDYDAALDAMRAAKSEAQLKAAFVPAAKRAKTDGDAAMLEVLTKIKDECKEAMTASISGDPSEGDLNIPALGGKAVI